MNACITALALIVLTLLPIICWAQSSDKEYLDDFMRVRGDASGKEVVYHWTGSVYSYIPAEKKKELFRFEGFNIARTVVKENGFELLTREAAFFIDPQTGQILENWDNPLTGKTVPVVQIWNDPVNQDLTFDAEYLPLIRRILPSSQQGKMVVYNNDIFPFYDNPLPPDKYGEFSQGEKYQSAEFFQFFVNKQDLENKELSSVPASISWTRLSPWMPFMRMGKAPGNLVFVCRGYKLDNGFAGLPEHIRSYVKNNKSEYMTAPMEFLTPNETSWTYFKKLIDSGQIK